MLWDLWPAACLVAGFIAFLYGLRMWNKGSRCKSSVRLDGKTVVITGGNTGIGKATALDLSRRGARVVLLCRSLVRGEAAANEITAETCGQVSVSQLDLSSLDNVRECAERLNASLRRIDILVNNAAVFAPGGQLTVDGFEIHMGTNHLGHFLLTHLLLPLLKKAPANTARVVTVSSLGHVNGEIPWETLTTQPLKDQVGSRGCDPLAGYCNSKLANVLFSAELGERWKELGIATYSLHPGVIHTELGRNVGSMYGPLGPLLAWCMSICGPFFFKTPMEGAQTTIYCCVEESQQGVTGRYYSNCREAASGKRGQIREDAQRLWRISEILTNLK